MSTVAELLAVAEEISTVAPALGVVQVGLAPAP